MNNRKLRALFLIGCLLAVISLYLPWLQLEVVPVQGRYLPELAYEQYGPAHYLYYASYVFFGLPLWSIFAFWRLWLIRKWPTRMELVALAIWLLVAGGFLWYQQLSGRLTLQLREGYYLAMTVTALLIGLSLWRLKAANTTSGSVE